MAKGTKGHVIQVIGTVVDIEFPPDQLPELFNAVEIWQDSSKSMLEVQGHIGNNRVRCLSFSPTEGLARGVEAVDTGAALTVPVGRASLGRLFNVLGEPLDSLGEVKTEEHWPIHRPLPTLVEQSGTTEMLETGLRRKRLIESTVIVLISLGIGYLGGFLLTVPFYFIAFGFLHGDKKKAAKYIIIALATTAVIYISFTKLMMVPLLEGLLWDLGY